MTDRAAAARPGCAGLRCCQRGVHVTPGCHRQARGSRPASASAWFVPERVCRYRGLPSLVKSPRAHRLWVSLIDGSGPESRLDIFTVNVRLIYELLRRGVWTIPLSSPSTEHGRHFPTPRPCYRRGPGNGIPSISPMRAQARGRFAQVVHMVVHSKAGKKFSCPAGRQQPSSAPVLARGGRHAGRGSGLGLVDIVHDGGRWSSRTGGPRTQPPACCHAHRDPAGCASSIRSSCPGSVAAGAGHPRLRYHDQEQERWAPVPLDDRVQQAITGQQRPTPGRWPRRRLAAFPYFGQRGSTASRLAAPPGRAQEAGRKIPDHHTQPGLAPSHYRTAPSEISGRPIQDLWPSDPAGLLARRRGTRPCGPALRPSCTGLLPARRLPRSLPPGRGRPRTRPCCVLTPDRRGWHSGVAGVPALAKTFLPGRIRQGPSMYEMEGPCPASPRLLASCLVFAAPRAARRGQVPARGPVSRLLPRSRGRPRVVPVSSGESISTASATTAQGPVASHFSFFRYPRRNPQKAGSYPHFTAVIHGFIHSLPTGYRVEAGEHLNRCRRMQSADRLTATSG